MINIFFFRRLYYYLAKGNIYFFIFIFFTFFLKSNNRVFISIIISKIQSLKTLIFFNIFIRKPIKELIEK